MRGRKAPLLLALTLTGLLVAGAVAALSARGGGTAPLTAPPAAPADGAGSGEVLMSADAASHPHADAVREQLQRHYDAINERDYAQWRATVVPARSAALDEADWQDAYASTDDGSIRVDRIDPDPDAEPDGGLLVRVRFISTQSLENAPQDLQAERICWRSTLPMRGTPPLIDVTGGGSSAREAC